MKIIHLSDLHFGTERNGIVDVLIEDIQTLHPDFIIVSGDLTQRARIGQFNAARIFLNTIGNNNILCVPGNHDISLYNPFERFFYPFSKYKHYIYEKLQSEFCRNNIAILGINSVTPFKPMGGYVTNSQLDFVKKFFKSHSNKKIKIVVMHHNLIRSERHKIINDAEKIISTFATCDIKLVLSGHIHSAHIEQLKRNFLSHNMYVITAGTPISTRTIAPNSYNVIEIEDSQFTLTVREFVNGKFVPSGNKLFPF